MSIVPDRDDIDLIAPGATYLLDIGRDDLLRFLPRKAKVAEIGVFKGRFSTKILRTTSPAYLALVDLWDADVEGGYIPHVENRDSAGMDRIMAKVKRKMRLRFPRHRIEFFRQFSHEAAANFPDREFDWIYVDADHSYDGVMKDLVAWDAKVADDGIILGHDFTNQASALAKDFGVVEAATEFAAERGYTLFAMTNDLFPTFAILKAPEGRARDFANAVIDSRKSLIRIDSAEYAKFRHVRLSNSASRRAQLFDFSGPKG